MGRGGKNSRLDFRGDPDRDRDLGFFKTISLFIIVIAKPRIKHDNPRWRFQLSECFLFNTL